MTSTDTPLAKTTTDDREDTRITKAVADQPRRTRQRTLIWDYLCTRSEFLTAQQIHDALRTGGTPVSLPTVYRTLTAMAESGDLDVLTTDGQSAYRRCSSHHHHHLVCRGCGRTIEVTGTVVEQWAEAVAHQYGFADITHITEFSGICPACQESHR
ncbi:MAG: transcriptional repressor [Propionibacteriaceae bacterium]|nr:transcriptional repressor [Propionibacteriaceae bacterium]